MGVCETCILDDGDTILDMRLERMMMMTMMKKLGDLKGIDRG